jgi:predicted DNA binding CopG/RHH family protein
MTANKIESTSEAWESGQLGLDEMHVKVAPSALETQVDDSVGLQMISIRLQKDLIDDFKKIADFRGIGYQPLMREALKRFVALEFKKLPAEYSDVKMVNKSR